MSKRRNYSPDTIAAMERFFIALDACIEAGVIKNISRFCTAYNIDKRHLYVQRKDLGRGFFEVAWFLPLVNDCGVSSEWLLTGRGGMFSRLPVPSATT